MRVLNKNLVSSDEDSIGVVKTIPNTWLGLSLCFEISIFKANLLVKFDKPFKATGFVAEVADYRMFNLKSLKIALTQQHHANSNINFYNFFI